MSALNGAVAKRPPSFVVSSAGILYPLQAVKASDE
jgi:hypothetical protein